MPDARLSALTALEKCRRADAWSDAVLGSVMDSAGLEGRDRALCTAMCYGVMQNMLLLDAAVGSFSSVRVNKLEPKVLDILRLSAYQILFMDRIPDSAAVNEGVRICKKLGYARASGLVNAVLRKIAANKALCLEPKGGTPAESLSLKYSHPLALTEYFISAIGEEQTEQLLAAHNAPVPITLQVNTLKTDTQSLARELAGLGLDVQRHGFLPDCLVLQSGSVSSLESFRRGEFYVQDAAAMLSVMAAAPKSGDRVLDVCSAPGGKSFAAALLSGGGAKICSCDIHENKLVRIRQGAQRLGIVSLETFCADARVCRDEWLGAFDVVIADVPCSGLGVIRKKPDIRYKNMAAFDALPAIGLDILRNVSRYVRPGGVLLFSTCTVRREENAGVAEAFLRGHEDFAAEAFSLPGIGEYPEGMAQLWPHIHGTDGFFFAKLRRIK